MKTHLYKRAKSPLPITLALIAFFASTATYSQTVQERPLGVDRVPYGIAEGPDGTLWVTENKVNYIAVISKDGPIVEHPIPTPNSLPNGIAIGADGNAWFVETKSLPGGAGKIARVTSDGIFSEYTTSCTPTGAIAKGIGSTVWFSEACAANEYVAEVSTVGPSTGSIIEHAIGAGKGVFDLAATPDGDVWFAEQIANAIGRLKPSGVLIETIVPTAASLPGAISVGPDHNIWFTTVQKKLDTISSTGIIREFDVPTAMSTFNGSATGPDGNLWLIDGSGSVWRVEINDASITTLEIPVASADAVFVSLTNGSQQRLWFVDYAGSKIGVVHADGIFLGEFEAR